MSVWIWTNIVLTLLAILFVRLSAKAPHRLRFFVALVTLCAWLVPWGLVGRSVPGTVSVPVLPDRVIQGFGSGSFVAGESPPVGLMALVSENAGSILIAATMIGFLLFGYASLRYVRFVRRIACESIPGDHLWSRLRWEQAELKLPAKKPAVRIQRREPGAVTTGVFAPTIWVHEDLVPHRDLPAALLHEYRHVRNHDNAYLWLITLIERLLWWNPLVRYLGSQTRRLQELSCDESCANDVEDYRGMLHRLVLASSVGPRRACPQTPSIHHSRNFNVERLRVLEGRYVMKPRHYLSVGLLLAGSAMTVISALAQSSSQQAPVPENADPAASVEDTLERIRETTGADIGPIPGFEPGTTLEQAERLYRDLRIYVALIERQFERQEAIIEELQRELEALQGPQIAGSPAAE